MIPREASPPAVGRILSSSQTHIKGLCECKTCAEDNEASILFLGTGSALPSKHRNVAGILLRIPGADDKMHSKLSFPG